VAGATALRAATGLALLALAAAALVLGPLGDGEKGGAQLTATSLDGSFDHVNSRDGQPVFTVGGLGPGGSASGDVTLRNTGTLAARFTLSAADLSDVPGPNGGVLSQRLRLTVTDVTAAAEPLTLYDGALATMTPRDVGVFAPDQLRTFRFVASLPDGGDPAGSAEGDNVFQAAQASVSYVWDAVEHVEAAPPDEPSMEPLPPPAQPPHAAPPPPSGDGTAPHRPRPHDSGRPRVRLRVPRMQRILASGHLRLRLRTSERARVQARGWLRAGRARLRLPRSRVQVRPGRTTLLRVRVPARHRRAMVRALTRGRGATLRIVVTVADRSGNRTVVRRTLRVRAG
jgi:hypothetical protein